MLMAVKQAVAMRIKECIFLTDSWLLVETFDPKRKLQPLQAADWRSYVELMQIANILRSNPHYCCRFIPREDNTKAHLLANRARLEQF